MRTKKNYLLLILLTAFTFSCTESFTIKTEHFESALIIEATLTNELKYQEVKLSTTYALEEDTPVLETAATVQITEDNQTTYTLIEIEDGLYRSTVKFKAVPNKEYQLKITRSTGEAYESKKEKLTAISQIDDLYMTKELNTDGKEEIRLNVDSFDATNSSKFYRYTYEETYKISSPYWSAYDAIYHSITPPVVDTIYNRNNFIKKTCYNTRISNEIVITETTGLTEDRVSKFIVRKILPNNYIIMHRYSILLKQFVQTREAHNYYKTLEKFSSSPENIFSQTQPGFIEGNIYSVTKSNERVIGLFEVSSVSTKRVFYNYSDFDLEEIPDYPGGCKPVAPQLVDEFGESILIAFIQSGLWSFYQMNPDPIVAGVSGPYSMVKNDCNDCRIYGTTVKPSFWID